MVLHGISKVLQDNRLGWFLIWFSMLVNWYFADDLAKS
jgi:hypothetical protein